MLKIWGRLISNNRTIKDTVVTSELEGSYQERLKECMVLLCKTLDIEKPYWLPSNLEEYNKRSKVIFDRNNFIDEIKFDRLIIEEIDMDEK